MNREQFRQQCAIKDRQKIEELEDKLEAAAQTIAALEADQQRYKVWVDEYGNLNWIPDKDGLWARPFVTLNRSKS